jgi:hypothetical protein
MYFHKDEGTVASSAETRRRLIKSGNIIPAGQPVPTARQLPNAPLNADDLDRKGFPIAANAKRNRFDPRVLLPHPFS